MKQRLEGHVYRSRVTKDASDYLKSGGEHGTDSFSGPREAPCRHPDFRCLALQTMRE